MMKLALVGIFCLNAALAYTISHGELNMKAIIVGPIIGLLEDQSGLTQFF